MASTSLDNALIRGIGVIGSSGEILENAELVVTIE
jgi:hypothetical protein